MQIRTGVYWSSGAGHGRNQDSLSLQHTALRRGECLLAIVCDGIGSLDASEEASGCAVRRMTDWYYHEGKELIYQNSSKEIILLALQRQFYQIQETLKKFQQTQNIQTGTTLTGILVIKNRYYLMHIGDSRIYHFRKKVIPFSKIQYKVRCLTKDDTNPQGYLLKCLGMAGQDRVFLDTGRLRRGTGFLLCTDGFYYGNGKESIGQVLGPLLGRGSAGGGANAGQGSKYERGSLDRRLELLGEQALRKGSRDNMAAIGIIVGGTE